MTFTLHFLLVLFFNLNTLIAITQLLLNSISFNHYFFNLNIFNYYHVIIFKPQICKHYFLT